MFYRDRNPILCHGLFTCIVGSLGSCFPTHPRRNWFKIWHELKYLYGCNNGNDGHYDFAPGIKYGDSQS